MSKTLLLIRIILLAALPGYLLTGCTKEARRKRLLSRAESDFKSGAYDEAKIEYLNFMRLGGQSATAYVGLGQVWFQEGVPLKAGAFLIKARELSPGDLENRLTLAQVYNAVGNRPEARKETLYVLQHSPANGPALFLLTEMAQKPEELSAAEKAISEFPEKESVFFYMAQANVAMRKMNLPAAQEAIADALAKDSKSAEAHHSRAVLSLLQKNSKQAREEFKAAANLSPERSSMKIEYADYLARRGENAEATAYLKTLTQKTPDFLGAWTLLARIALSAKKVDESLAFLENVFSRDPQNVDARLFQADALLEQKQLKKAIDVLEALDRSRPGAPGIKFQLAKAYLQDDKPEQASAALQQATAAKPDFAEAILLLAKLNLRTGQNGRAIDALEGLLKKRGNLLQAQLLLADAYRAAGRLDDAAAIFKTQIAQAPKNAEAYSFLGVIQRQQNQPEKARQSFQQSMELAPENVFAVTQLLELDLAGKDFASAMRRADEQLQKNPNSGYSCLLKGKVLSAKKEWPQAEATLKKAIELDPGLAPAYDLLVGIYLETGKADQAMRELQTILTKSPQNKAALMTLASLEETQGAFEKARDTYEKLLSFDPNDVTALNNLAFIYTERLNQGDKGVELARKARTQAPGNPAVADTLGWALFKRGDYQPATTLLEEAAEKSRENPEVRFHSGMAHYMMGQTEAARSDFQGALSLGQDFPGKKETERRLELLNQTAAGSHALTAEELEGMLKEHPKDIVARLRLAKVLEGQKSFARAATTYEEALKSNPKLGSVALELAELYAGPLKNPERALEFAKKARDLAPSDPRAAGILGHVAFDAGNFAWAYSLLQESAREASADSQVLHDLAWAAYSLGKVDEARVAMQQSLEASAGPEVAADAKSFLALTGVALDPARLAGATTEIQQKVNQSPPYVPAWMAAATLEMQSGRTDEAVTRYQAVLKKFPDFSPAQKELALLYANDPARVAEAYDLAVKARKNMPDDPEVAKLLGRLSCERKEYSRALQLLQESARKKPLDAQGLYYLGISYKEAKQPVDAKKALTDALSANLPAALDVSARQALAELQKR